MTTTPTHDEDYIPNIMEDDDLVFAMKNALQSLRPVERKIFLTYTELGAYTTTAKAFKVSVPTIRNYINEIRKKITDNDNDNTEPDTD